MSSKSRLNYLFCILLLILMAGCSSMPSGSPYTKSRLASNDHGVLVLYRPYSFVGGSVDIPIKLNGQLVTHLPNNGYFQMQLPAGEHKLEAWSREALLQPSKLMGEATLNIAVGETLYLKGEVLMDNPNAMVIGNIGSFSATFGFVFYPQSEDAATSQLACCNGNILN